MQNTMLTDKLQELGAKCQMTVNRLGSRQADLVEYTISMECRCGPSQIGGTTAPQMKLNGEDD
jgi:hypothetical protein